MEYRCPECGAAAADNKNCQSIFDTFLALEFSDPEYGAVHFLTVSCFMIQHGRYSDEGLAWIKEQLRGYFQAGTTPAVIIQTQKKIVSNASRKWKIMRQAGSTPPPRVAWSMTIADVASTYNGSESYRNLIHKWGETTLAEMP